MKTAVRHQKPHCGGCCSGADGWSAYEECSERETVSRRERAAGSAETSMTWRRAEEQENGQRRRQKEVIVDKENEEDTTKARPDEKKHD